MESCLTSVSCSKLPHTVMLMQNDIVPTVTTHVIASLHPESLNLHLLTSVRVPILYVVDCSFWMTSKTFGVGQHQEQSFAGLRR